MQTEFIKMSLYSYPLLKYRTRARLRISKQPGLLSWISFLSISILGILLDYYTIPDFFTLHAGFLTLCLIFGLSLMKTWDLVLDREENLGIVINRSWYQALNIRLSEENVVKFPLSEISSVIVSSDYTIDIRRKNGTIIQILSESSNYRMLKKLRKEIAEFLCLERMENIKSSEKTSYEWDIDPWSSSSATSENQESDLEILDNPLQNGRSEDSQFLFGSNIKIISGVL